MERGALLVPRELDVGRRTAADPELAHARADLEQVALALGVPIGEEGAPRSLGLDLGLQLDRRGGLRSCILGHDVRTPPGSLSTSPARGHRSRSGPVAATFP